MIKPVEESAEQSKAEAAKFLRAIDGDPEAEWLFFTVGDADRDDPKLKKTIRGTLDQAWPTLVDLNERGAGIFVTINEVRGKVRKAKFVTAVRAAFVDLDGAPIEPVLASDPPPHVVVESSPGKYHACWRVADLPTNQFGAVQQMLQHRYDGDTVSDLPRVMRLPGTLHLKQPDRPFIARVVHVADDLAPVLLTAPTRGAAGNPFPSSTASVEEVERLVDGIPNDSPSWADWNTVGLAIHAAVGDEGREIFHGWSRKWTAGEYSELKTDARWDAIRQSPPDRIGVNKLRAMYREARAARISENVRIGDDVDPAELQSEVLTLDDMLDRLVLIRKGSSVADLKTGRVDKREDAVGVYAASKEKGKPLLRQQWLQSKHRKIVDTVAWVPGEAKAKICRAPETDGTAFNLWRGLRPLAAPDDWRDRAQAFLDHVAYLIPVEAERERFLDWLAHIVQRPEVLPHTSYLMTTRQTGIGRNWLSSVLVRVLRGHVAAGVCLPDLLNGGFTGRLSQKLLAVVDEAKEGSDDRRWQRADQLKRLITEEHRHINHKYGLQVVEKNCCRWLMFSNHLDALPFDNTDRRIVVIQNPTVRKDPEYYAKIYALLDDPAFIGSVRRLLELRDIRQFLPGEHAPMNEAKEHMLDAMRTDADESIAEFIEDWEHDLASFTTISDRCPSAANFAHVRHAITRAGMVMTGRRMKFRGYMGLEQHRVVIVKGGDWTVEKVKAAAPEALIRAMGLK